ncbi:uncharacterized protein EV422DRAFT_216873 [Fimicolochytrium jonesii]|uniref:uncharacterized protein n=1 Tax=Fimicolochytrium jonesii TaxID=1396493 RepID=UPI0022FF0615|nr:uncharacterized protein EV422DRAFT_216873 [Fimicolochytrium jonesii]KAI8817532.1 hypothetical protein EV422DRAFT_216873 [Fimicolochytrium jonesii]
MSQQATASHNNRKLLITGATGYIGGTVLAALAHTNKYHITALVRDDDRANTLKKHVNGINTAVGGYTDYHVLENAAKEADIVVHTAESADNLDAAKAILKGLQSVKRSFPAVYIHTSGTGVLSDSAQGHPANPNVYTDVDMSQINTLADDQPHRNVDLEILNAVRGKADTIRTAIVCPPLIYGLGTGAFNVHSQQVPAMIKAAQKKGHAVHAGKGDNLWNNVHVRDLAKAFTLILEKLVAGDPNAPVNENGYYFVENGEHSFRALATDIALALEAHGVGDGKAHPLKEAKEIAALLGEGYPGGKHMLAGNSRSRAVLVRKLGWQPVEKSLGETVPYEVAYWVDQAKKQ